MKNEPFAYNVRETLVLSVLEFSRFQYRYEFIRETHVKAILFFNCYSLFAILVTLVFRCFSDKTKGDIRKF